ncbi:FAD-binding oxidoreductase [Streptomyces sp. WMMB 322]|uniref:FAD-binding oxidoreductase n=1 Tax=Streptomyces sp. WMMB 322 TaxID=1286821 RepID=UPI0006E45434|nr:FAD-binding oxidoreductase [Streptomyces sp. WMMB 322]SCK14094.1 FAD/FMN-containing dehydrogenase [Streptomyces sp. WMMB 322]
MDDGSPTAASRAEVPAFPAGRVRGPVLLPSDERYLAEVSGFQSGYRHHPEVVVCATDAADVSAAVEYAAAHRLPLAVQATGHGLSVPLPGGVLVSTRRMTDVRVNAGARTAWIGAGVRWGEVVEEAGRFGLAPLSGSGPGVGAVSYTLHGGVGLLAREFGYAADHVSAAEVVTSDGRVRHVTADSDPELFRSLRGGGGSFGVVTGLEIGLVPVERFYGGQLIFDGESAGDVLEAWRWWTATVPERLTSSVTVMTYPDIPVLPGGLRGRHVAQVQIAYDGDEADGERLVAPLRAAGPRIAETLRTMPWTESWSVYNEPDRPHPYEGTNALLGKELPDRATLRSVLEATGPDARGMVVLALRHMGGALSRQPAVPNAVGGRDAGYLLVVLTVPAGSSSGEELRRVQERVLEAVAPWTVGSNLNFRYGRSAGAVPGGTAAAFSPDDHARLTGLKASADPSNLFRFHHVPLARDQPQGRHGP